MLLILAISIISFFIIQGFKDPLYKHLSIATDYKITKFINNNGIIDVTLETLDEPDWIVEGNIQLETRIVFNSIKNFPRTRKELDELNEVTVRFVTKKTNKKISKITVSGARLIETAWSDIGNHQLVDNVDFYNYKEYIVEP
jgi:predicted transcriptional regulator